MPLLIAHGGGCCGIRHIYNFDDEEVSYSSSGLKSLIQEDVKKYYQSTSTTWNCLVEAVLNEWQVELGWDDVLKEVGFKLVTKLKNSNSGNECYVFHLQTAEMK